MPVPEIFLQRIWELGLFEKRGLYTTAGEPILIVRGGEFNTHAGPDFMHALLRIGDTLWAGNIEVHTRASQWFLHHHQQNPAYHNTILHVVYHADTAIYLPDGTLLPTLELQKHIRPGLLETFSQLMLASSWISCQHVLHRATLSTIHQWLSRLTLERLEQRRQMITALLDETRNDWNKVFYYLLARNFGFKVNTLPFELLARSLDPAILARHHGQPTDIEALLFGQAGLLKGAFKEKYPQELQKTYLFLQHKYGLKPIEASLWKFMRMRPANFPTLRLAQFASLIQSRHLPSLILETEDREQVKQLFHASPSGYWDTHYRFGHKVPAQPRNLGKDAVNILMVNTVAPFLFAYGKARHMHHLVDRAIHFLENTNPESNSVITSWKRLGITALHAAHSQALLLLKHQYCNSKNCLSCGIGHHILTCIH